MYKCLVSGLDKFLSSVRKKSIQLSIMLEDLPFCSRFLRQILGVVDVTLIGVLTQSWKVPNLKFLKGNSVHDFQYRDKFLFCHFTAVRLLVGFSLLITICLAKALRMRICPFQKLSANIFRLATVDDVTSFEKDGGPTAKHKLSRKNLAMSKEFMY